MLDIDRRTMLAGSLATLGSDWGRLAAAGIDQRHQGHLTADAARLFALNDSDAWLVAQRLYWSAGWPRTWLVTHATEAVPPGDQRGPIQRSRGLPARSLFACYGMAREAARWRRITGTSTHVGELRMTAYRCGRHVACLIQTVSDTPPASLQITEA